MDTYYITLISLITLVLSINPGSCKDSNLAIEGEDIVITCKFNITKYNDDINNFKIDWFYPDIITDEHRISFETTTENNTFYSYLFVEKATKSKDEGKYFCILNNNNSFVTEKYFDVIFKEVELADEIDSPKNFLPNDMDLPGIHFNPTIMKTNDNENNNPETFSFKPIEMETNNKGNSDNNNNPRNLPEKSLQNILIYVAIGVIVLVLLVIILTLYICLSRRRKASMSENIV